MTLEQIVKTVLREFKEDTDTQTLEEYEQRLTGFVNEGYFNLMSVFSPVRSETVRLTGDYTLAVGALSQPCERIIEIRTDKGYPLSMSEGKATGEILLSDAKEGDEVLVKYAYMPRRLQHATDSPLLPEHFHSLLVQYAAYREHITGSPARQARAAVYKALFEEGKRRLQRNYGIGGHTISHKH